VFPAGLSHWQTDVEPHTTVAPHAFYKTEKSAYFPKRTSLLKYWTPHQPAPARAVSREWEVFEHLPMPGMQLMRALPVIHRVHDIASGCVR